MNGIRWYFYVYSPTGQKLRSNAEIMKYLRENPDMKCDLNVTNTSKTIDVESLYVKIEEPEEKLKTDEENPYGCNICDTYFSCQSELVEHIEVIHNINGIDVDIQDRPEHLPKN